MCLMIPANQSGGLGEASKLNLYVGILTLRSINFSLAEIHDDFIVCIWYTCDVQAHTPFTKALHQPLVM